MKYCAIVLVPTLVRLQADSRALASEEARTFARAQELIHGHNAKVLEVLHDESDVPPPDKAA